MLNVWFLVALPSSDDNSPKITGSNSEAGDLGLGMTSKTGMTEALKFNLPTYPADLPNTPIKWTRS